MVIHSSVPSCWVLTVTDTGLLVWQSIVSFHRGKKQTVESWRELSLVLLRHPMIPSGSKSYEALVVSDSCPAPNHIHLSIDHQLAVRFLYTVVSELSNPEVWISCTLESFSSTLLPLEENKKNTSPLHVFWILSLPSNLDSSGVLCIHSPPGILVFIAGWEKGWSWHWKYRQIWMPVTVGPSVHHPFSTSTLLLGIIRVSWIKWAEQKHKLALVDYCKLGWS